VAVEAGREEQPRRRECRRRRGDELVHRLQQHVARRTGGQGHVHGRAGTGTGAGLVEAARERIERELVERHVQDARVLVEGVLRAVAMVGVPVEDQHALASRRQPGGGDRHVVEEAEAHRPGRRGVVARRPQGEEGGVGLPAIESLDGVGAGAGPEDGGTPRLGDGGGVGVEVPAAAGAEALEGVEVRRRVEQLELLAGRRSGRDADQRVLETGVGRAAQHGVDAGRSLGVTATAVVLEVALGRRQQDRHRSERTTASS
jgi:hypothetical protein